jgi:DNA-binding IclR family transcriptional regulator
LVFVTPALRAAALLATSKGKQLNGDNSEAPGARDPKLGVTAGRVADLLVALATSPVPLGVSQLARQLGLSKSVVHRMLQALCDRDLLAKDPATTTYRLGPVAMALGRAAELESQLRSSCLPVLTRLRDETGETATLSAVTGSFRVYVAQVESMHAIRMSIQVGLRVPLTLGCSSQAILAHMSPARQEAILATPLQRYTGRTVVDPIELRDRLERVREQGWSRTNSERLHETGAIGAPIFHADGVIAGALSVCGPISRFDEREQNAAIPAVLKAARAATMALSHAESE